MQPKTVLAATAALFFGYVAIVTRNPTVRRISALVIANAILCHVYGKTFIEWDVFCNVAIVVVVLALAPCKHVLLPKVLSVATVWLFNHFVFDSVIVHACLVQGTGAMLLHNLKIHW